MNRLRKIWMVLRDPTCEVITAEDSADTLYELQRMSATAGDQIRTERVKVADIAASARARFRQLAESANNAAAEFADDDLRDRWL